MENRLRVTDGTRQGDGEEPGVHGGRVPDGGEPEGWLPSLKLGKSEISRCGSVSQPYPPSDQVQASGGQGSIHHSGELPREVDDGLGVHHF